jgi:hypothetical protein
MRSSYYSIASGVHILWQALIFPTPNDPSIEDVLFHELSTANPGAPLKRIKIGEGCRIVE